MPASMPDTFLGNLPGFWWLISAFSSIRRRTACSIDGLFRMSNSPEQIFETIYKSVRRNPVTASIRRTPGWKDGTFADNLEQPDITGGGDMRSPRTAGTESPYRSRAPGRRTFTEKASSHRERAGLAHRTVAPSNGKFARISWFTSCLPPGFAHRSPSGNAKNETQVFGRHQRALCLTCVPIPCAKLCVSA